MEDFKGVVFDHNAQQAFFAVLDGHGGDDVADFAREETFRLIKAINDGFMATHCEMQKHLGEYNNNFVFDKVQLSQSNSMTVKNDMILVRGEDEDSLWKALVLAFSIRQKPVTVKFFETQSDRIWIPENSPAQEVHPNSVLGIDFDGDWTTRYTQWEEFRH